MFPVSEPVEKLEGKLQTTGEAKYVDDIPKGERLDWLVEWCRHGIKIKWVTKFGDLHRWRMNGLFGLIPCLQCLESCLLPWSCPQSPPPGPTISHNSKLEYLNLKIRKMNVESCLRQAGQGWPLPSSCFARGLGLYWPQVQEIMTIHFQWSIFAF